MHADTPEAFGLDQDSLGRALERIVSALRSVRAFLPDPLPRPLLERLLTIAGKAPSNCNAQPWVTHVVSGETLARLRAAIVREAEAGRQGADVPPTSHYVDQYRARRIEAAVTLFEATGVGRDDAEARRRSYLRNHHFFDAPHAAFFFMPRYFGLREAADVGMYLQTLMLAVTAHGLASCPQTSLSYFASTVKRELGVSDDLICLFGLSFGRADETDPSTAAITSRAPLAETVRFHN